MFVILQQVLAESRTVKTLFTNHPCSVDLLV